MALQVLVKHKKFAFRLEKKTSNLDPRLSQGIAASNISRLLFEGLTYIDSNGKIFPGIAKNIHISPDLLIYTFTLRDAKWSNGQMIKASDFEYAWKSVLNPDKKAPMAYMLFGIKGAKSYFDGTSEMKDIGIQALDDKTLVVTLENPSSYFLQLTATSAYLPVNQEWTESHLSFTEGDTMKCVSNGPFSVASFVPDQKLELVRNIHYWANTAVKLDKALINFTEDSLAISDFQKGDVDWVGSPLTTLAESGQAALKESNQLMFAPAAGTQFLRLNVTHEPFSNVKFRKALLLSCDTQGIVNNVMKGSQKPAGSFVPPGMGLEEKAPVYDISQAAILFEEALLEMSMTRNDLPELTFTFLKSDRMQKMAQSLVQNWKAALNIEIAIKPQDSGVFYDDLFKSNYQIAAGSWFADYFDPMSFLSVFQTKNNGINCTNWSNPAYTDLLNTSNLEIDPTKRMALLQQAQDILMQDAPILPLFHFVFAYGKNDRLEHSVLSPMGMLNIDDAYFIDPPKEDKK